MLKPDAPWYFEGGYGGAAGSGNLSVNLSGSGSGFGLGESCTLASQKYPNDGRSMFKFFNIQSSNIFLVLLQLIIGKLLQSAYMFLSFLIYSRTLHKNFFSW